MNEYDLFELGSVSLQCGITLPDAKIAYKTYGKLNDKGDNVILMPTFFGGYHSDTEAMMQPGRFISTEKYFIIVPNLLGNGLSSSPSNTPPPFDKAGFPAISLYDNVVCQHRLVTEKLGLEKISLVVGFSMGAQQAFQWGALYPNMVENIAPLCGSARTSAHNKLFLESCKLALCLDSDFKQGWYATPPIKGIQAFSRIHASWSFSQDFFREEEYRKMGLSSVEDVSAFIEGYFRQKDANDLLAMLQTWHNADVSQNPVFKGDLEQALGSITARAIVMPCETDLYFRTKDNELEVAKMPNAELRPIPSIWGHMAPFGVNQPDNLFIDRALADLLSS